MTDTRWSDGEREGAYADSKKKTPQDKIAHQSFETCREACEVNERCLQFSFKAGRCRIDFSMKLGKPQPTKEDTKPQDRIYSGWMVSRITKWVDDHQTCKLTYWPTP
ncbi:unnamed protein product [Parascedosporium putredinis]|uniref:Apple domain-containing protein n=1 Tax=Parascedosporium putredinis TaxID=1442378 RepID=A0A9P1HDL1_9PEZI|nr:unnamed protein product [Parascedosporium putredinis]CAI8004930.1 unnamed protein product [Parascedosporium putredinis]